MNTIFVYKDDQSTPQFHGDGECVDSVPLVWSSYRYAIDVPFSVVYLKPLHPPNCVACRFDNAVTTLTKEMQFYSQIDHQGRLPKVVIGLVLVHLHRGDSVAAELALKAAYRWGMLSDKYWLIAHVLLQVCQNEPFVHNCINYIPREEIW